MPTRKQRRRRQKDLRHEYEYVYVDGEGQEVEVDPAELEAATPRRNGKAKATPAKGRTGKPIREVQPPSCHLHRLLRALHVPDGPGAVPLVFAPLGPGGARPAEPQALSEKPESARIDSRSRA